MKLHPDLDLPWCRALLDSGVTDVEVATERRTDLQEGVSNTMFAETLYTRTAIRAQVNFQRPTSELDSIRPWEYCYLLSVGTGIDGKTGRAHGGFNSLILDHMTGTVSARVAGVAAPATATMTVDYKAPIETPGVILCRGWVVERQGRKTWVKATIEDGRGKLLASGKALFIDPRPQKI